MRACVCEGVLVSVCKDVRVKVCEREKEQMVMSVLLFYYSLLLINKLCFTNSSNLDIL